MSSVEFDVCFVGGGIASLYAAYKLLQKNPHAKFCILERNERAGGRAHNVPFHGVDIVEGAGVGRYRKDRLLRVLMQELGFPVRKIYSNRSYIGFEPTDILKTVQQLKVAAAKVDRHKLTFAQFARKELGIQGYRRFVRTCGYTDFENADIIDTLDHYGFDDTLSGNIFYVPWNALIEALIKKVGHPRIILNSAATRLEHVSDNRILVTHTTGSLYCKKVVVGTTIDVVQQLLPSVPIYKGIVSQPFLRVYAKIRHNPEFAQKVAGYTVVAKTDIQKLIPMGRDVYMIAYADNKHAVALAPHAYDKNYMQHAIHNATGIDVEIEDIFVKYWMHGTHFYPPLPLAFTSRRAFVKKCQNPHPNVFVVGEAVSLRNQGWTQGALESVEAVMDGMIAS